MLDEFTEPHLSSEHRRLIEALLKDTRANSGLTPVDLDQFWADQAIAVDDPFGMSIPQVPLGIMMSGECVYDELGIAEDYWRYEQDEAWRQQLHHAYNDIAERIVGCRLLSEEPSDPQLQYPPVKGLADVFGARNVWHGESWWLMQSAYTEDELRALLDRVEACDIRACILPENWDEEKARLMALGVRPPTYTWQRGPVTFATSIYGVENLIYLIMDNPDLAARFRDAILRTMLEIGRVMFEEAGYTAETFPHGFGFADDNCYLMTPDMYEFFGFPILEGIFNVWSPEPGDFRFQHSDSAMSHLLPLLGKLQLTGVNFGPTVTVSEIRQYLPHAVIHGQLAPFTFSRNEEANILAEFLRDFTQARKARGLLFSTAGSINNGSRLTGMRLIMSAIQHFGRYI